MSFVTPSTRSVQEENDDALKSDTRDGKLRQESVSINSDSHVPEDEGARLALFKSVLDLNSEERRVLGGLIARNARILRMYRGCT